MYLLKCETKIVQFEASSFSLQFEPLQISVKGKFLNSKKKKKKEKKDPWRRIETLFDKNLFRRNFDQSIKKFFLLRGYSSKI